MKEKRGGELWPVHDLRKNTGREEKRTKTTGTRGKKKGGGIGGGVRAGGARAKESERREGRGGHMEMVRDKECPRGQGARKGHPNTGEGKCNWGKWRKGLGVVWGCR